MAMIGGGVLWATQVSMHGTFWLTSGLHRSWSWGVGTAFAFIPVSIAALAGIAKHEAAWPPGSSTPPSSLAGR